MKYEVNFDLFGCPYYLDNSGQPITLVGDHLIKIMKSIPLKGNVGKIHFEPLTGTITYDFYIKPRKSIDYIELNLFKDSLLECVS